MEQTNKRGLRNNNPLNMERNRDVFQGEITPSQDVRFKQFKTMAYGYRAAFVDLSTKLKRGINTIEKIIRVWAPSIENHTDVYIDQVEKWSGVPRNKELNIHSGKDYLVIVAAMSRVENGVEADTVDIKTGFLLQDRIK